MRGAPAPPTVEIVTGLHSNSGHILLVWNQREGHYEPPAFTVEATDNYADLARDVGHELFKWLLRLFDGDVFNPGWVGVVQLTQKRTVAHTRPHDVLAGQLGALADSIVPPGKPPVLFVQRSEVKRGETWRGDPVDERAEALL